MCLPGARQQTEQQLKNLLHFQNIKDQDIYNSQLQMINYFTTNNLKGNLTMNIANRLYPSQDYTLKQQFIDALKTYFKSDVQQLNYSNPQQSSDIINSWVEQQTSNKITNLIQPDTITPQTKLILVNAIYFKFIWLKQFNKNQTQKHLFRMENGLSTNVDIMYKVDK